MRGLRKIAAIGALTFAFTGIAGTANAAPAQAATTIYGKYVDSTYWGPSGNYYRHLPARYYWVDYNWFEETVQGKQDCYCHMVPLATRP